MACVLCTFSKMSSPNSKVTGNAILSIRGGGKAVWRLTCEVMQEGDALGSMYEKDGLLATEDGNIFMWAGATVGGGTRVNW